MGQLRWQTWKPINTQYVVEAYSVATISAAAAFTMFDYQKIMTVHVCKYVFHFFFPICWQACGLVFVYRRPPPSTSRLLSFSYLYHRVLTLRLACTASQVGCLLPEPVAGTCGVDDAPGAAARA